MDSYEKVIKKALDEIALAEVMMAGAKQKYDYAKRILESASKPATKKPILSPQQIAQATAPKKIRPKKI